MFSMHIPHHIDSVGPTVYSISRFGINLCLVRRFNKIRKFGTTEPKNRFVWCADSINVLSKKFLSINCECEKHLVMAATNIIWYYFANIALHISFSSSSNLFSNFDTQWSISSSGNYLNFAFNFSVRYSFYNILFRIVILTTSNFKYSKQIEAMAKLNEIEIEKRREIIGKNEYKLK